LFAGRREINLIVFSDLSVSYDKTRKFFDYCLKEIVLMSAYLVRHKYKTSA